MKILKTLILCIICSSLANGQHGQFEPSVDNPFGSVNPEAPSEVADYADLIGQSVCSSIRRNPDGTWQDTVRMTWTFKYILDGTAVQDLTVREDGGHATSIRQYNADSAKWFVTYFPRNNPPNSPSSWAGNATDTGDIVLLKNQKAPNGFEGISRLVFSNITEDTFDWEGTWTSMDGTIQFPFWTISCKKTD